MCCFGSVSLRQCAQHCEPVKRRMGTAVKKTSGKRKAAAVDAGATKLAKTRPADETGESYVAATCPASQKKRYESNGVRSTPKEKEHTHTTSTADEQSELRRQWKKVKLEVLPKQLRGTERLNRVQLQSDGIRTRRKMTIRIHGSKDFKKLLERSVSSRIIGKGAKTSPPTLMIQMVATKRSSGQTVALSTSAFKHRAVKPLTGVFTVGSESTDVLYATVRKPSKGTPISIASNTSRTLEVDAIFSGFTSAIKDGYSNLSLAVYPCDKRDSGKFLLKHEVSSFSPLPSLPPLPNVLAVHSVTVSARRLRLEQITIRGYNTKKDGDPPAESDASSDGEQS